MEVELEPRVKPLPFKVKAMSRESPAQKASHVLDPDLRNHWSTGTNTKEWILLELDEPCLLSHIRIYNKSVLEWEISVGLRYKPETFAKARPRCEAPRRDMMYPMNYTPCRYIRISCLRGSPIAIFFIQLIGISVTGLEPEFQPAVDYLLPHIVSHRQDTSDLHLQLLQDITTRLAPFLPQLEGDLNGFSEAAEPGIRFLAMLVGQFYPILHLVKEREATRLAGNTSESETSRNNQMPTALTVSSNFEPRRSRNASSLILPTSSYLVFRPDAIFMLLRKAHKDYNLGNVCRVASQILLKFMDPSSLKDASQSLDSRSSLPDEGKKLDTLYPASFIDYSDIFGEEFRSPEHHWDSKVINVLDIALVEEGVLHVLYACASQPLLCSKFADNSSNFWSALPLVQALLPALRPNVNIADQIDDSFSQWKLPFVQQALSQIVGTSSSSLYRPLLHACAGYLSSFSPTHAKASCVLIDMCSGVLAPWMTQVIAKMDLTVELLEDLLAVIQGARHSFSQARAALKYIVLALSGHMDEVLSKYKDAKHRLLFLIEMLEPYLDPAITPLQSTISFGNISSVFLEKQEHNCALALNVIRTAVRMPALLPSLEAEWRRGSVSPSVLLSVLEPHIQLPPDVNLRQFSVSCLPGSESSISPDSTAICNGGVASTPIVQDGTDGKTDVDMSSKMDLPDEVSLLFAPPEINRMSLITASGSPKKMSLDSSRSSAKTKANPTEKDLGSQFLNAVPGASKTVECHYLQADYLQLVNHQECQLRSSEFRRLALDLHSQNEVNPESHDAAIDALLLAAECYVNPYFMMSFKDTPKVTSKMKSGSASRNCGFGDLDIGFEVNENDLKTLIYLERKRDKIVLEIMLQAAELDRGYQQNCDGELPIPSEEEHEVIKLSEQDTQTADAVTLLRQNQALLCNFVIQRLQRDNYLQHEVLLQTLLFLLHSGTKLFCAPADIIEIILRSAEHLNRQLTSFYYQLKEGSSQLEEWKLQLVQRLWMLLQRLVVASSGSAEGLELSINVKSRFQFANLIPPSAWLEKIPTFSSSVSPLARFLGWMAISRNAIQYQKDRLFLVSDIEQLTYLLHVFSDELAAVDNISECKDEVQKTEESGLKQDFGPSGTHHSFHIMYPDISHFFPTLKKQFETLGESILQAVALQLRSLPATTVPDLICWFSEFCSQPFIQNPKDQLSSQNNIDSVKGFVAKNAKAIVLYVLEAIVTEHMEAIVPEVPRVVQVLVSLCRSSYCDVSFLNSVMLLLKPIISYSLQKASAEERLVTDSMCLSFESLCFDELFGIIKSENESNSSVRGHCRALMVFVLASVFPDISSHCKIELLNSSITSADFASFEQTTFFHDYLCAYQALMESCKVLIVDMLRFWGVIPCKISQFSNMDMAATNGDGSEFPCFLEDMYPNSIEPNGSYKNDNDVNKKCQLKIKEIESFSKNLDTLVSKLSQNVEQCYRIHRKLAKNLTQVCAECFLYLRCLSSIVEKVSVSGVTDEQSLPESISLNEYSDHWKVGLEGLAEMVILLQEHHCWEVASMMLDCLFHVPQIFNLHDVIDKICSAIKTFSHGAPIIAWRLQTDKWMSSLFARGINCLQESEALNDLLHSMLCHPEPEQRFIALKQLGKLVSQDGSGGSVVLFPTLLDKVSSERASSVSESVVLSALVSSTWDQVALLASSDTSLPLRINAMALLVNYVPLVERPKLQSFLAAADCVLRCLTKLSQSMCEGPLTQLSIALFACICLYSPAEDISLIPENLWRSIESFSVAGNEKIPMGPEKTVCQALCRLRKEGDEAKKVLKEAISSSSPKQVDPGFASTRETILEVITNLTSVQSYLEFFSKESDHKVLELEEAEIEMELLQKEKALQELSNDFKDQHQLPLLSGYAKNDDRLQQIRDGIKSMEKARLREQIVARRQKKLLTRRARQTYLEEAAIREAQLLQELDRERTAEVEREIERQRLLELERAKTRELRHNLDLEKEKQTQRELQRELEQVESGLRPSRREFSSTHTSSRPRERYRERENGRAVNEGTLKASTGAGQPETVSMSSSTAAMPTVMLSGARQFSSQLPTILQSRDRSDEGGNSYDDNFDGSRDSGDTGSIGDADIASALDGVSMNFGPSQKHGSRGGGKSRQIMERRDRDGRREGKWERKH